MNRVDAVWKVGHYTIGTAVRLLTPLRSYGAERVPRTGGVVLAFNHFHWIDPPVFGLLSPRTIYYVAKVEAHRIPGLGQLIVQAVFNLDYMILQGALLFVAVAYVVINMLIDLLYLALDPRVRRDA